MERLTDEYMATCPRDGGLILRGRGMTRIETFVDAAFAFALTLLVISIDEMPRGTISRWIPPDFQKTAQNTEYREFKIPPMIFQRDVARPECENLYLHTFDSRIWIIGTHSNGENHGKRPPQRFVFRRST